MCNACLEDDVAECNQEQTTQNCLSPTTDSCFTGAGRYKYNNGSTTVYIGIARGCVDCSTTEKACEEFTKYFNALPQNWTLSDCNIVCCKGDKCNNQTISVKPTTISPSVSASVTTTTKSAEKVPTTTSHASRHVSITVVLAIAAIIGALFF
ncbi:hypothetical protein OS493_038482 [Desmophyllum pertusum]|uniref:Uncharacterized protein n=1 Tax=Desmophyllum pertusum TaxID=174260 RepID=A0A9W9ZHK6_9CNID|nr:hypothetical protein OS493_038482 [Desmophyllum pertusum]